MSDLLDVMESTQNSGSEMITSLFEYGDNSLGKGIRRLANDMLNIGLHKGYEQGANDMAPIAFGAGLSKGRIEGTIITVVVSGTLGLLAWGINKWDKKKKSTTNELDISEDVKVE